MSNKVLDYMIDNEKNIMRYCMMLSNDRVDKAQDLFQETACRFLNFDDTKIKNYKGYIKMSIYNNFLKLVHKNRDLKNSSTPKELEMAVTKKGHGLEFIEIKENDKILHKRIMKEAYKILPPSQLKALLLMGEEGKISTKGPKFESIKRSYGIAIDKLKERFANV